MLNKNLWTYVTLFIFIIQSHVLMAKTKTSTTITEVPTTESPGLTISEGISDSIYQQTTANITGEATNDINIESSVRIFFPSQFELTNKYFKVPYSSNAGNFLGFMIGPNFPVASISDAQINSFARLGYAYAQGIYQVESDSGLVVRDAVELQWLPLQIGIEALSRPFATNKITAGVTSSLGVDWYTQSGQLDGIDQTFWMPRYEMGVNLTFFPPPKKNANGFNGVRTSAVYYRSFASAQKNRGWAVDLGTGYAF